MTQKIISINDLRKRKERIKAITHISFLIVLGIIVWRLFIIDGTVLKLDYDNNLITDKILDYVSENGFKGVTVKIENYSTDYSPLYTTVGLYSPTNKTIIIFTDAIKTPNKLMDILYHEYGHHIYFFVLDENDISEYSELFIQNCSQTKYGLENGIREDFAESYMLWKTTDCVTYDKHLFFTKMKYLYGIENI